MSRGPALAVALVALLGSLIVLLAASVPAAPAPPQLPGVAAPGPAAVLPHACASSYAYDRLADARGGVPQQMGLDASGSVLPPCL